MLKHDYGKQGRGGGGERENNASQTIVCPVVIVANHTVIKKMCFLIDSFNKVTYVMNFLYDWENRNC